MDRLNLGDSEFVIDLYRKYLENHNSVDQQWQDYFATLGDELKDVCDDLSYHNVAQVNGVDNNGDEVESVAKSLNGANTQTIPKSFNIDGFNNDMGEMVKSTYRRFGHLIANLDPLGLNNRQNDPNIDFTTSQSQPVQVDGKQLTVGELETHMRDLYSNTIGYEFMHIHDYTQRKWVRDKVESLLKLDQKERIENMQMLIKADMFDRFLDAKFPGAKRFGLEGGETTICCLEMIFKTGVKLGLREVVVGMAHRGRLNILHNTVGKSAAEIMSEFSGECKYDANMQTSGDVKYHLGASLDKNYEEGGKLHISLTPNPSHLEIINPVVMGRVRAKQQLKNDKSQEQVMGILLHGDAAFAGQGVVPETLMLSKHKGYRVGGMIHVITNNQIGFSTDPHCSRSSTYCSDVAKMIDAPIFHVNGDDPEAVAVVSRLAMEYRQTFKSDVVIDICCYRFNGHNEMDEPMFTQPLMYKVIKNKPTTKQLYIDKLVSQGSISQAEVDSFSQSVKDYLEKDFKASKTGNISKGDWFKGHWQGFTTSKAEESLGLSSVAVSKLKEIGTNISTVPQGFDLNKKLARLMDNRLKMIATGENIDWGMGEALAFATLVEEGYKIRLSGQDSCRGTFSHRHAVVHDQANGNPYWFI